MATPDGAIGQSNNKAVVASLPDRSSHQYSSIAVSPNRQYAVVAGKDTLQLIKVGPEGLESLRSMKISQHFYSKIGNTSNNSNGNGGNSGSDSRSDQTTRRYGDVRDTFKLAAKNTAVTANMSYGNIVVTRVAWSMQQRGSGGIENISEQGGGGGTRHQQHKQNPSPQRRETTTANDTSLIAAAGSNGVVVVWTAKQIMGSAGSAGASAAGSSRVSQQPEAVLSQHTRAVNSLAWHPKRSGLLLTASQDATIKLWERRAVAPRVEEEKRRTWFSAGSGGSGGSDQQQQNYSWFCKATFEPKCEAVRDIKWNEYQEDIFGLVTVSGTLAVYSMHTTVKALVKIAAHTGDATSLDWHPIRPFVVATGGSADRSVKVWDLEASLDFNKKDDPTSLSANSNTWNTTRSEMSTNSTSSNETDKSLPTSIGVSSAHSGNPGRSTSGLSIGGRPKTSASAFSRHVLSISASVTQVRWRPPSYDLIPVTDISEEGEVDRHDSMLVVATARLTSVGGSGVLSLWSFNRPYMALSVVEGHDLGAVADFVWLQTPTNDPKASSISAGVSSDPTMANSNSDLLRRRKKGGTMDDSMAGRRSNRVREADTIVEAGSDAMGVLPSSCIWQNLLSVGKDGRCIIQSLARGDRPIRSVPSSCFAMANLSPFQRGYGSLQCFSVYQDVPNHLEEDFMLTGLRQDEFTASAPGVFHEDAIQDSVMEENERSQDAGKRLPASVPELVFSVVDQGSLYENGLPVPQDDGKLCVAPEVVHLSRFARSYKLYPDAACATRVDLCIYNGEVAEELKCMPLARMWKTISSLLRSSGYKGLPSKPPSRPANAFQFAIFPTIRSLLLERAEAGDVQTCVVLCEVLQVIESGEKTRIPGLGMSLVREWYLSYIDLLHQMCLFSAASFLIKNCKDEMVGALNQQSTTIHESCPQCGKPLQPSTDGTRQACKNCRRRVGMCFICHEPVQGMFVWCPGCGHGGHLEHALQWFGGLNHHGKAVREFCPTGCGHRCNFVQMVNAFPRTDSFMSLSNGMPEGNTDLNSAAVISKMAV